MQVTTSEDLLVHQFGDEAILLDLRSEIYYTLNESGIRMWQALMTTESVENACELLVTQYDEVPREMLWSDLHEFIEELKSLNLIEVHE